MKNQPPSATWIVLPVYFDADSFLELQKKITEKSHFLVIDDSAGLDPSLEQLNKIPNVRIITCPENLGHQKALVFGLRTLIPTISDEDTIITMDSDGQDLPADIPRLLERLKENPEKIILAFRTKRPETLSFKILYFFFKILFRIFTGCIIRTGNFAAFRVGIMKGHISHWHFDLCYSSTLLNLRVPLEFIDCERGTRLRGKSKMNFLKLFTHGLRMMLPFRRKILLRMLILLIPLFLTWLILK